MADQTSIAVVGATGRVGSQVVDNLFRRGAAVRAVTRRPQFVSPKVEVAVADLDDPVAVGNAIEGVAVVVLITADVPNRVRHQANVADACVRHGVRHIVNLSSRSALTGEGGDPYSFGVLQAEGDAKVTASGIATTHVRPGFFMQNLLVFAEPVAHGVLPIPIGDAAVAMVDSRDVSDALSAIALREPAAPAVSVTLTGPTAVTGIEVATIMTATLARPVAFVASSPADAAAAFEASGLPAAVVGDLLALFAGLAAGRQAAVTGELETLIGRPPRDVATFLADHRSVFARGDPGLGAVT